MAQSIMVGKSSRQELETETMAEHCSLACLGLLSYRSYIAQIHLAKGGVAHSGPPTSVNSQGNAPASDRSNSSAEAPSSLMTLVCAKLTKTNQHTSRIFICNFQLFLSI